MKRGAKILSIFQINLLVISIISFSVIISSGVVSAQDEQTLKDKAPPVTPIPIPGLGFAEKIGESVEILKLVKPLEYEGFNIAEIAAKGNEFYFNIPGKDPMKIPSSILKDAGVLDSGGKVIPNALKVPQTKIPHGYAGKVFNALGISTAPGTWGFSASGIIQGAGWAI